MGRCAHPRSTSLEPRRSRRRAAGGRHRAPRAGLRAGRRRHRQDPHDHPPHRPPGRTPGTSPPARCSRSPSPRGRRARCGPGCARSASPACRPARSTPPRCASCATSGRGRSAARRGRCWRARCGWSARPPPDCAPRPTPSRCATSPARSSGRRPAWSPRRTTRPRWPGCAARPRARPSRWPPSTPATRRSRTRPSVLDFDDLLLHTAARTGGAARRRRGVPGPLPLLRRRRVPGRQPAAAAAAGRLARRPRRPHRGRRRQPDDLLLRRRHPALPAGLPAPVPGDGAGPAGARLPVDPAGGRRGQPADRQPRGNRPAGTRLRLVGQRPPGRSRSSPSTTTSPPRRPRWPRGSRSWSPTGTPAAEIAVLFRINAQSEAYEQALTEVGRAVRGARRRAVLRAARGAPGDDACCGPPRPPGPARRCPTSVRAALAPSG